MRVMRLPMLRKNGLALVTDWAEDFDGNWSEKILM
jgi:hypothetical protein